MEFTVNKPLNGHDEDAPAYADGKFIIVCDGLGASGQNSYLINGEKRTSAYLGSRVISGACVEFVEQNYDAFVANMHNPHALMTEFKSHISSALDRYVAENGLKNIVKGKSIQMLPSTLAAVVYKHYEDHTDALVISAGDSRAFVLTPDEGLQQISRDDVFDGVDAFCKSATMTNNIRQDGEYHINYGYYSLPPKCILLVCTDGCFDYINSPMELEFRLEFSLNKCGDLFEEGKNNFGEYYGNLLVNSGLKDDCTVAGVFLGYEDSASTKELFLQRALHVKNKYRDPYAEYDKKSLETQNDIIPQIPEVEKKLDELKKSLDFKLKSAVVSAYKDDVCGTLTMKIENLVISQESIDIMEKLAGFELYKEFSERLRAEEEEATSLIARKEEEYTKAREQLVRKFTDMHFEKYIGDLLRTNHSVMYSGFGNEETRLASDYRRLMKDVSHLQSRYGAALTAFAEAFEDFKKLDIAGDVSIDMSSNLNLKYNEMLSIFSKITNCKQDVCDYKNHLETLYRENCNVEGEYSAAWKSGFSRYKAYPQYRELYEGYRSCMDMQAEIDGITPNLTNEQKISRFNEHIEANWQEYADMIKSDMTLCCQICGNLQDEIVSTENKLSELKKASSEYDDKKYALWAEYKPVYELYEHCTGGTV